MGLYINFTMRPSNHYNAKNEVFQKWNVTSVTSENLINHEPWNWVVFKGGFFEPFRIKIFLVKEVI